ncbi:MAG: alanine--tRNA ligase [Planctomycetaceae bacterium]|nr:alanine--tRNA ligase [Planctomycetaceae bacterium]
MKSANDIRNEFLDFFAQRGHTFVPSSSLLPGDDPTLLFTNAGMNQFKGIFLGQEKREYVRAHNSQKCIRAGGKHNDLEDVGHDTYHHTFFEMLGNWSFGDYFKADAIAWAWELLTGVWGLPKDRLYATVLAADPAENLAADDEARQIWQQRTDIDPSHIVWGKKKDNFWEMGETGPCGPCTEIHIDLTPDKSGKDLVNAGDRRVMEIWNLVFIQFNRDETRALTPLPAKHVDTGMGLERICMVLQGKSSNYATDLFVPLIEKIETLTTHRYGSNLGLKDRFDVTSAEDLRDVACRVIADHARTLTFAIADGIIPSNEGRGYVLRRILRRAARYGRQYLDISGSFLVDLVPKVVEMMGKAFPELGKRQKYVIETIASEEESFGRTLDRGIALFEKEASRLREGGKKELPGEVAFDLYATFGFPVDLTQIMAAERGLGVEMQGYAAAMAVHKETSAAGGAFKAGEIHDLPATDDAGKYHREPITATVLGWVVEGAFVTSGKLAAGQEAAVVLDQTNFYAEQGGQVGDTGVLTSPGGGRFEVTDTRLAGPAVLHVGRVTVGALGVGDQVECVVSPARMDIMRNHTATHLLNWALRAELGEHINQAGSEVAADRLRFDFSHNQAMTDEQLHRVETMVNERILADEDVSARVMPLADATKIAGVRAVFGEKYPDPVRVVAVGQHGAAAAAVEFCGGTHLDRTGQVGLFKILSQESVAKGVRRITAVSGRGAVAHVQEADRVLAEAARALKVRPDEIAQRIEALQKEIKDLRKKPAAPAAGGAGESGRTVYKSDDGRVLVIELPTADVNAIRNFADQQRQKGAAAVMAGGAAEGKVCIITMVDQALADAGKVSAADWAKAVAPVAGGGGGGKPILGQAGGKDPTKLPAALDAGVEWVRQKMG